MRSTTTRATGGLTPRARVVSFTPAFYPTGGRNSTAGRFRYDDSMITRRSRAREVALQLLFQRDLNPKPVPRPAVEQFVRDRLTDNADLAAYCLALYDGVVANAAGID